MEARGVEPLFLFLPLGGSRFWNIPPPCELVDPRFLVAAKAERKPVNTATSNQPMKPTAPAE